jgi:allophanate hydrolase
MARLIVENPGLGVTVQDRGRAGWRKFGVPVSGALDRSWLAAANVLAGAPEEAAALEILLAAPVLVVEQGPARIGLAGDVFGALTRAGESQRVEPWRGLLLRTGDRLALKLLRAPAYLAFSGGLDAALVLGSRSTYARAGLGRALDPGDVLLCADAQGGDVCAPPLAPENGPLRFIPGPQDFPPETLAAFVSARWTVRPESDRMGLRLAGPHLVHGAGGANIVSDGVTPGAIQVPGDGQPILLRADGQTSGGYAKIGCVISADLDRMAHLLPGEAVAFAAVDQARAARARTERREGFAAWREKIAAAGFDEGRLWSENLIGGAIFGE